MKIRIKFAKQGAMKFIGHLDIMRYFQKAMRRADVDICYSEGFSPHQIMSFASPLSVGLTSVGEYMDIEVHSTGSSKEMTKRLNQVMAEGMEVLSYRKLPDSAKNAMSIVAAADYTIRFREGKEPEDWAAFSKEFSAFTGQDAIRVMKQTKRSEKEVDLKPLIFQVECKDKEIFLQLSAGSGANLKPELLFETFYHMSGKDLPEFALMIRREEIYADLGGKKTGRQLQSLEQLGEEIE